MSKTQLEYFEPMRDDIQESIWKLEFQSAKSVNKAQKTEAEVKAISEDLEAGKYQLEEDVKKALKEKEQKVEEHKAYKAALNNILSQIKDRKDDLAFIDDYIKNIK